MGFVDTAKRLIGLSKPSSQTQQNNGEFVTREQYEAQRPEVESTYRVRPTRPQEDAYGNLLVYDTQGKTRKPQYISPDQLKRNEQQIEQKDQELLRQQQELQKALQETERKKYKAMQEVDAENYAKEKAKYEEELQQFKEQKEKRKQELEQSLERTQERATQNLRNLNRYQQAPEKVENEKGLVEIFDYDTGKTRKVPLELAKQIAQNQYQRRVVQKRPEYFPTNPQEVNTSERLLRASRLNRLMGGQVKGQYITKKIQEISTDPKTYGQLVTKEIQVPATEFDIATQALQQRFSTPLRKQQEALNRRDETGDSSLSNALGGRRSLSEQEFLTSQVLNDIRRNAPQIQQALARQQQYTGEAQYNRLANALGISKQARFQGQGIVRQTNPIQQQVQAIQNAKQTTGKIDKKKAYENMQYIAALINQQTITKNIPQPTQETQPQQLDIQQIQQQNPQQYAQQQPMQNPPQGMFTSNPNSALLGSWKSQNSIPTGRFLYSGNDVFGLRPSGTIGGRLTGGNTLQVQRATGIFI